MFSVLMEVGGAELVGPAKAFDAAMYYQPQDGS